MKHSDSYNVYTKNISDGMYKEEGDFKRLARELITLRGNGQITEDEQKELLLLGQKVLAGKATEE